MWRKRPTSVLVMAILNLNFAVLGLIWGLGGLAWQELRLYEESGRDGFPMRDQRAYIEKQLPGYTEIEFGNPALLVPIAILLAVAGVGLLRMQPWGRRLSIACGLLIIAHHVAYTIYEVGYVIPCTDEWQEGFGKKWPGAVYPPSAGQTLESIVVVVGPRIVFCVHAMALLIILFLPGVSRAFAARKGEQCDDAMGDGEDRTMDWNENRRLNEEGRYQERRT